MEYDMQDDVNPAGSGAADEVRPGEQSESGAAGEVIRRTRFGIGARSTILMGMAMGAVAAVAPFAGVISHTVSYQ
jgi:hypothetical protein